MTASSGDKDLIIAELRHKLAEAESTLSAIREGEVDASIVRGSDADEVFSIGGDDESYRAFMEAMEPGAAALDAAGRVLYVNSTLSRLLGKPLAELQGKPFRAAFQARAVSAIDQLLQAAGTAKHSRDISLQRPGGEELHFIASATPLRLGTISGHAVTLADATEHVRAEAAMQSERIARAVIASANEAVLVCDRKGVITHTNVAANALSRKVLVGRSFSQAVPLLFPVAAGVMRADDIIAMATAGKALQGLEVVAAEAPEVRDYLISAGPLRITGDQISGCVIAMMDLSQRKAAEKQQLLLMGELDHRVKNTLALVLSISSRTAVYSDSVENFEASFTGRIQALAATHTLLADRSWNDLVLRQILSSELAPHIEANADRVTMEGLDISVTPRAAIAIGLIVHELITNAVKHGALSREGGHIRVRSIGRSKSEKGALVLEWQESGGPPVSPPRRQGFGQTVIARSLQYSPEGGAEVNFNPSGLVCRLSIPAEDVRELA